jgi:hypothetical protein
MTMKFRSQRGEGAGGIILGALVLAIVVVIGNWALGFIQDTKDARAGNGKKKYATPTPYPVTAEPGGYTKTYKPVFSTKVNPSK